MKRYCFSCMHELPAGADVCPVCGLENKYIKAYPHQLQPGTILENGQNRYLIGKVLGQGGFGITYIGMDLVLEKRVAIKEYYPNGYATRNVEITKNVTITELDQVDYIKAGKERFLAEARTLARFDDPGIVHVKEFFQANDTAYIIMEYLDGQDLSKYLAAQPDKRLPADEVFTLFRPVMDALEKVHAENTIHRDIAPDNLMLLKNHSLKLMDFGAARVVNYSDPRSMSIVLKSGYAPIEQYSQKGNIGPWTDIYALCATMYRCITGKKLDDSLDRRFEDTTVWPSEMGIAISPQQEAILKKGLSLEIRDRFQNIGEMKAMLAQAGSASDTGKIKKPVTAPGGATAGKQTTGGDSGSSSTPAPVPLMKRLLIPGIAALLVVLVIGGIVLSRRNRNPETAPAETTVSAPLPETGSQTDVASAETSSAETAASDSTDTSSTEPVADDSSDTSSAETAAGETSSPEESDTVHITLIAPDTMTAKDFNNAIPILQDRLDIFADGRPYEMVVKGAEIDLQLPKEQFRDEDYQTTLRASLSRAMNLSAFSMASMRQSYASVTTVDQIPLPKDAIQSVTYRKGEPGEYEVADWSGDEEYYVITLTYSNDIADQISEKLEAWGEEDFTIGKDIANSIFYYYPTFVGEEPNTLNLLLRTEYEYEVKLAAHNLSHESLPDSFFFNIDLKDTLVWQDPATTQIPGALQCGIDDFTGSTITLKLETISTDTLSAGQLIDLETAVKERMDAIGMPYAFSEIQKESDGSFSAHIRTVMDHMGYPTLSLITEKYGFSLIGGLSERSIYSSSGKITTGTEDDGTPYLELALSDWNAEYLESVCMDALGIEKTDGPMVAPVSTDPHYVSLCMNKKPILKQQISSVISDGVIRFTTPCISAGKSSAEKNSWIFNVMEKIWNGTELPTSLTASFAQYQAAPGGPESETYPVQYDYDIYEGLEKTVTSILPTATCGISSSDPGTFFVALHLDLDLNFVENALTYTQQIYEALDFDSNLLSETDFEQSPAFKDITFYLMDEDDNPSDSTRKERARIYFRKEYSVTATDTLGLVYASGVFYGGRLEQYKDLMKEAAAENEFLLSLDYPEDQDTYGFHQNQWDFGE